MKRVYIDYDAFASWRLCDLEELADEAYHRGHDDSVPDEAWEEFQQACEAYRLAHKKLGESIVMVPLSDEERAEANRLYAEEKAKDEEYWRQYKRDHPDEDWVEALGPSSDEFADPT